MKRIMLIIAVALAALAMLSCEKYEDGRPSKDVRKEFSRMYPDASDVEWEWTGAYWEVSFETGKRPYVTEHEACYEKDGKWLRTTTEMLLSAVPDEIREILAGYAEYGDAPFADEDVYHVQTQTGEFYRFTLRVGSIEVKVDVHPDGQVTPSTFDF